MLDAQEAPESYEKIKTGPQNPFTEKVSRLAYDRLEKRGEAKVAVKHSEIFAAIPKVNARLAEKYPDLSKDEISQMSDFYFGIYSLDEHTLGALENKSQQQKVRSAQIQQARAHHILYASFGEGGLEYAQKVLDSVAAHEAVARSSEGEKSGALLLNAGVNAFVGVSKYFYDVGFDIYLPDYRGDASEVKDLDVELGIDGLAVKLKDDDEPLIILFDAKGRRFSTQRYLAGGSADNINPQFDFKRVGRYEREGFPESLLQTIDMYTLDNPDPSIYRARVELPMHTDFITYFQSAYLGRASQGPIEVLKRLDQVSPDVKHELNEKLKLLILDDRQRMLK